MSFALSFGTLSLMKKIVFDSLTLPSLRHWVRHWICLWLICPMFLCVLDLKVVCGSLGTLLFPCRRLVGPLCCIGIDLSSFCVFELFWLCCLLWHVKVGACWLSLVTFPWPFLVGWLLPPLELACWLDWPPLELACSLGWPPLELLLLPWGLAWAMVLVLIVGLSWVTPLNAPYPSLRH